MWQVTGIAVARNKDERLALVATAGNKGNRDAVWHLRELDATAWSQLDGPPGGTPEVLWDGRARPAIAANADGRFEVVAIGTDAVTGKVWHAWQKAPNGDWSDWKSLESPPGEETVELPPALARNKDGRLEVFVVDRHNVVWHRWQERAGGDRWAPWHSLKQPGPTIQILWRLAVGQNLDGRLELFVTANDGAVWHKWQDPTAPDGWSGWRSFKPPSAQVRASGPPAVVQQHVDGRLDVFVTADDGAVWHVRQTAANNGWSGWESLDRQGAGFVEVAGVARPNGALVLFAVGGRQGDLPEELWSREQAGPNNAWRPWRSRTELLREGGLDGPIEDPTLVLQPEPDDVAVVLFLNILETVSLHHLRSPVPELWAYNPRELQLPPGVIDEPDQPV